jgi:hypothetical protein
MKSSPSLRLFIGPLLAATALCLLTAAGPALANGNYSHLWIAADSLTYVEEGEQRDLLIRPELLQMIRNGAMYPDGGYAVGDGYGETSHWEPFHLTYLEWIRENYEAPWSDEAAQHIAFLMGMAAHGIADQLYDGMYLERHEHYDEHGSEATLFGVDGATDACFAVTQGVMELPEIWVPADVMAPLYAKLNGHQVSASTIQQGQNLVVIAIMAANDAVNDPDLLAEYMEFYPWACGNQDNPEAPGSPVTHGPAVASYWGVLWARLHGDEAFDKPLLDTFFTGGTPFDQPLDVGTPDSWVSFAVPHGLDPGTVNNETVTVINDAGGPHAVKLHVYYGNNSHLVNIKPQENWLTDTSYTVTVAPPMASWQGTVMAQTHTFEFATFPEPPAVVPDTGLEDVMSEPAEDTQPETVDAAAPDDAADTTGGSKGGCSMNHAGSAMPLAALLLLMILLCCCRAKEIAR